MAGGNSTPKGEVKKAEPAIGPPPEGIDPDWATKIATAKRIMKEAREARRGKPIAARTHRWGPY